MASVRDMRKYRRMDWGLGRVFRNLGEAKIEEGGSISELKTKTVEEIASELKIEESYVRYALPILEDKELIERAGRVEGAKIGWRVSEKGWDVHKKLSSLMKCYEDCLSRQRPDIQEVFKNELITMQFLISPELLPNTKGRKSKK